MESITINPETARADFERMVKSVMVDNRVQLGNVEFWIDADGAWAGEFSYSLPTEKWDMRAITRALAALLAPCGHNAPGTTDDAQVYECVVCGQPETRRI